MRLAMAFGAVVVIWSTTPLAIKLSTETLSVVAGLGLRMALGALICGLILIARGQRVPLHREALASYGSALLGVIGAMSFVYWSVQSIPSGLVSVVFGLAPLLSGLLARWLLGEDALTPLKIAALGIALGGLAVVFHGELRLNADSGPGLVAAVIGTLFFCLSGVLVKRHGARMDPLAHTTGSLLFSVPIFALGWWLFDGHWPQAVSARSIGAVVYLALVGSVLGFMLYFYVLQRMAAAKVALVPLITPVFALILGARLADETVSDATLGGTALILGGLLIYQFGERFIGRWSAGAATQAIVER